MAEYDLDSLVDNLDDDQEQDLEGALQENVLTVLCFDEGAALLVRRLVEPKLFENEMYKRIAQAAFEYIDETGKPPADHLPDMLEEVIAKASDVRAQAYKTTLRMMRKAYKTINVEFVMSRLSAFVDTQRVKGAIVTAIREVDAGRTDHAKAAMEVVLRAGADVFDPGIPVWDPAQSLTFFDIKDNGLRLGIKELDTAKVQPAPKELFTFIAPTGKGKTWFLLHVARAAMYHRKKTVFISLEMSPERLAQRFTQMFFRYAKALSYDKDGKKTNKIKVPAFKRARKKKSRDSTTGYGRFEREEFLGMTWRTIERPTLEDENARADLARSLSELAGPDGFHGRLPLRVKQFPPASLTIKGLEAYLDGLDHLCRFHPDVVIIDYPDLMKHNPDRRTVELEQTYQALRGLAIDRDLMMVVASQSNRLGATEKVVTLQHVADAIGKVNVSDNVVTYSQIENEQELGFARLFVAKGRNDMSNFTVLISQCYWIGQFCWDSMLLPNRYWEYVDGTEAEQDA